jgi:hypothetical protein
MKDLRIKESMTKKEKEEYGEDNPHRIEYVYGAVTKDLESRKPIILNVKDFWMPVGRAKQIHAWLGKAIAECEKRK